MKSQEKDDKNDMSGSEKIKLCSIYSQIYKKNIIILSDPCYTKKSLK
jgi:hypothetical protein